MPTVGIKDCRGGLPKSGIPVRLAPQNICDVNPYVCRMTPASIDFKSDPPFVGKLSFEPHPRGCQCCSKAQKEPKCFESSTMVSRHYRPSNSSSQAYQPRTNALGYNTYGSPARERSTSPQPTQSRLSPQTEGRPSMQPGLSKKQKKTQAKREKKLTQMEEKKEKLFFKQQKKQSAASQRASDYERVRLLREQKRRDDFVTACCSGLLLTPCVSAGSCSEEADEREQANFYIQCKCCPASNNVREDLVNARKSKKRADFPCQCRNCKYQDKGCTNLKTGCLEEGTAESPVCFCTDEEKVDDRPHRVCDDQQQRGAKTGQRGFYPQGDGTACDEMMPTKAALLTCSKQDGDGTCTKAVMTAELMQEMLIKQAQQVIQMANSLLTNKKFQLVNVTNPDQNIPMSQIEGRKSQPIQTSRIEVRSQNMQTASSRSTQPVELNDNPNLKCYLQNIDPSDAIGQPSSKIVRNCLCEPLPRPPLNPSQPGTYQDDKLNSIGEAQYQSQTLHRRFGESAHAIYNSNNGMGSNKPSNGVPSTHSTGAHFSYQVGSTGHICIPRDALIQDPMNPNLCIPLSFNPQLSVNCPFVNDHVQDGSVIDPGFTEQSHKGLQKQKLVQGSNHSLKQGSHHGLQRETSRGSHRLQQPSSRLGLEISQKGIQKQDSSQELQKESSAIGQRDKLLNESCRIGQQDKRHQLQATSGRSLQEGSSKRIQKGSSRRDRDRHRRDSDRERPRRDSARERPRRDSDRERRRRELKTLEKNTNNKQPKPRRESMDSEDIPTLDPPSQRRRKRSNSPCNDKNKSSAGKRRPSPSEMVRTLNNYETDLLQAMDKVKGKYLKERGNETSSSRGSSFDSMTPGLAEFNCLLKHITCLRKELKKYSKDTD